MRFRVRLIAFALAGAALSRAQEPVRLPTYTVSEPRLLPKPQSWRYGQVPGFEILSDASDAETRRIIRDFLLFQRAVGILWPLAQRNFDLPVSLILCAEEKRFAPFMPANLQAPAAATYSLSLRERELAAIVLNLQAADPQTEDLSAYASRILRGEYIHFLLSRTDPPPPPWIESGLGQILLALVYDQDRIGLPGMADTGDLAWRKAFAAKGPAADENDPNLRTALSAGAFMPLPKLFVQTTDPSEADSAWGRECYQFVHLCLFGQGMKYAAGLEKFSVLASLRPPDDALFRQCFGIGLKEMFFLLWGYTDFSSDRGYAIQTAKGRKPWGPPALALGGATDAESGRIAGDALRMAGRADAAHYQLIAPYLRGARDPQLLADLGLEESEAGRTDRARKFLEAAVAAKTSRARAYYELARLRMEAAGTAPLPMDTLVSILGPLWESRGHPPPLRETYELLARAWSRSAVRPQRGHLLAIDQGLKFFPYDTGLILADARLRAQYGYTADAAALANLGLGLTRGAEREPFLRIKSAQTPAAAAPGPKK